MKLSALDAFQKVYFELNEKDISHYLIECICQDPFYTYIYVLKHYYNNYNLVPQDLLYSISKNMLYATRFSKYALNWKNIPNIIMSSLFPGYAYDYVKNVLHGKNVPHEIMKSISKDPYYSYLYAKNVLHGENVPHEIMKSIISSPLYSYFYVIYVLHGENVSVEILDSIKKDNFWLMKYNKYVEENKNDLF